MMLENQMIQKWQG